MTLKYQLENLEGVDEALHGFYEQGDNGYTLKIDGVVPKSQFDEINQKAVDNATEAQRRRKTVERVLGKLGLEDASGLDDALDGLLNGKGKSDKDQEAIIAQIKADAAKQVDTVRSELQNVLLDGGVAQLEASLVGAGFAPKVASMLARTNKERLNVDDSKKIRIMGENGNPLAGGGADGYATFADLANELAAAMPELLIDKGKGGGGKPPASQGSNASKTVTRAEFDAMSQRDRADFAKNGGKVTD